MSGIIRLRPRKTGEAIVGNSHNQPHLITWDGFPKKLRPEVMDRYYLIIVKAESAPTVVQPLAKGRQNVDNYEQNLSQGCQIKEKI